jgi:hypothetical protein
MMTTLEKIQQLAHYVEMNNGQGDIVLDVTLDKLLARERMRHEEWLVHLQTELTTFEEQFGMATADFYALYQQGEMGDDMDVMDWASLYDMYLRATEQTPLAV